jgi:hypothetical protein
MIRKGCQQEEHMAEDKRTKTPTDYLKLSSDEMACIRAAAQSMEAVAPELGLVGFSGRPTDNRIFVKQLIADVLHTKYDACVQSSISPMTTPQTSATPTREK